MQLPDLFQFYGIDWLAMGLLFVGMYLITQKQRVGFAIVAASGVCWIGYAFLTGSVAQIISNTILIVLNLRGYVRWAA